MSDIDPTYLKQKLSAMSDDELYQMIQFKASQYHEQAISLAKEEVARRKLEPTIDAQDLKSRIEEQKGQAKDWNKEQGLRTAWLEYYVFGLFASAVIYAILGVIGVVIWGSKMLIYTFVLILICIVSAVLSYGLRKRALWAWKLNNALLTLSPLFLIGASMIMPTMDARAVFMGLFFITLLPSILNYIYFKKKKKLFS